MLEKINRILNIIMGSCIGVFIGHGAYVFWDCKAHPELYAMQSAPWYSSILIYGTVTIVVLITAGLAKGMLRRRGNRK